MVGLGNPGPAYAATRHNAGFMLADMLAVRWDLPPFRRSGPSRVTRGTVNGSPIVLLKPETYMNRSGPALRPMLEAGVNPSRDLLVLVDDFALSLGRFRLRAHGSAGGHNGLESVEEVLDTQNYARLRIGVGPLPDWLNNSAEFVLSPFEPEEFETLEELLPTLMDAVTCWISEGIETAMNRFNRRGPQSD